MTRADRCFYISTRCKQALAGAIIAGSLLLASQLPSLAGVA